jgi:hypothetical protein
MNIWYSIHCYNEYRFRDSRNKEKIGLLRYLSSVLANSERFKSFVNSLVRIEFLEEEVHNSCSKKQNANSISGYKIKPFR